MPIRRNAFTLVELLVVIGIIAMLIGILLPALNKARQLAVTVQCESNMRQLGTAVFQYADENKGRAPYFSGDINPGVPGPTAANETQNIKSNSDNWDFALLKYISPADFNSAQSNPTNNGRVAGTFNQHSAVSVYVCPVVFQQDLQQGIGGPFSNEQIGFNSLWGNPGLPVPAWRSYAPNICVFGGIVDPASTIYWRINSVRAYPELNYVSLPISLGKIKFNAKTVMFGERSTGVPLDINNTFDNNVFLVVATDQDIEPIMHSAVLNTSKTFNDIYFASGFTYNPAKGTTNICFCDGHVEAETFAKNTWSDMPGGVRDILPLQ
jgi:prepilin-type N-terminal cleavage/methylation domain-containing protein/prepilin-type processing-associated H-X9-DG protein